MPYGSDPNAGPTSEGIISVYMNKLKRKLAKHGIIIRSLIRAGYSLPPESKKAPR